VDWETKRLKYAVNLINIKVDGRNTELPFIGLEDIESWTGKFLKNNLNIGCDSQANEFQSGDVLFGKLRPYLAKVLRVDFKGICTGELLILRSNDLSKDYIFYYLLSHRFINVVNSSTYGAKMPRANWEFIGNLTFLIPTQSEQRAIAAFLDRETSRIDRLIEKKEKQMELLKEKRAALISHIVTKGLDPNVKMKDSGIEWLGEIPEGWRIFNLKRLAQVIDGDRGKEYPNENDLKDSGIPFLSSKNIIDNQLNYSNLNYISPEKFNKLGRGKLVEGDIIITVRGTIGSVGLFKNAPFETAFINAQMMIIRPCFQLESTYFRYFAISKSFFLQINASSYGAAQQQLSNEILSSIIIVVPPINDQKFIATFLDRETTKIDALIEKVQESIEILKEYRTALISAAVTGKIDVRGFSMKHINSGE
jgi:type I restriction enzyme S subunit